MNKLKEIEEPQKNLLTKLDIQEALQFIRSFLIDQSAKALNKEPGWNISNRDISMNLKRIPDKSPITNYDDLIFYISKVHSSKSPSNFTTITFRIAKKNDGKVLVSWRHFYDEGPWYIVSRGFVKPKSHEVLPENVGIKFSKEDEQRAFQAIRSHLVPRAVQLYNQRAENENSPKVDIDVVRRNLKKKRETYKGISYYSEVNKDVVFVFTTLKSDSFGRKPKQIMVHCINPIGCVMGMYIDEPESLNEDITSGISKMDEQRAVQYIKYRLIPFFVDKTYNVNLKRYPRSSPKEFPRVGYQTFRNALKKKSQTSELTIYRCDMSDRFFIEFHIVKNPEGDIMVGIKDNLNGYLSYNFPSGWYRVQADPPTELKEGEEEVRPGGISKIEEQEALQFIRNVLIDKISKHIGFDSVLIRKTLKKVSHKTHSGWSDIKYDADVSDGNHSKISFGIFKNDNGQMVIGVDHDYDSYREYHVENTLSEGEIPKELLKYSISKLEEAQAVDYIKKVLIPKIVAWMNDISKHYTRHPIQTPEQITKTVRKVEQYRHGVHGYMREFTYEAVFLGEHFLFDIFKNTEGALAIYQKSDGTTHLVK